MPDCPPVVSCLCVTENRAAFMPWLVWSFERQTWPNKELVVVDSSQSPLENSEPRVRVVPMPPGTSIAGKRNRALDEARGAYIAWLDDDDWQHPARLSDLSAPLLRGEADLAGATSGWFIDLWKSRCAPYHPTGDLIFNSCLIRTELARTARFDERLARASDTPWIAELSLRARGRVAAVPRKTYVAWLCHDTNASNRRGARKCLVPVSYLEKALGSDAWGETEGELQALRARLAPDADP